jgi:hypothetical protein
MMNRFQKMRAGGIAHAAVTFVRDRWNHQSLFTRPTELARHLGCDWVTAEIILTLGREQGHLARRDDGRWYYERHCVMCGCSQYRACSGGCSWVGSSNVCSRCDELVNGAKRRTA